jgi:hypothetical protein
VGFWANSIRFAGTGAALSGDKNLGERNGFAAWLVDRVRHRPCRPPRLAVIERISLAPRQTLSLVEADGQKFLVATSSEGAPVFYSLSSTAHPIDRNGSRRAMQQTEQA